MNIFLITSVPLVPPWDQGDKNLAYALTRELSEHHFRILTTRDGPTPIHANLQPEPIYHTNRPSLGEKARVYWRLLRMSDSQFGHRKPEIDIYHLIHRPYALSSWLCRLLPEFRRRPTMHTVPATADGRPLGRHLFFAHRLVVLSEHGLQALQRLGLTNVVHIPPGIEVARWATLRDQKDHLKAQLGLADRPVLLFPSHYSPGYGADMMLAALPLIAAQVPGVQVIFACRLRSSGDRERERTARQMVTRLGLGEAVRFYNTVADMRPLIGASDLTLLPLETMRDKVDIPTILLESLAAGKPVVISDLPPMNELLESRGAGVQRNREMAISEVGLAVPPGDAKALSEAVVALLKDASERERMGRRGQELVRECFDIQQVARQYEKLYQEMIR